jgi:UDP-N-acetylglucosamine transferase subunit ALG13
VTDGPRLLVVCLVGTDHHPFARLISWCDSLAASRPDVDVVVQHGSSGAPTVAVGHAFLSREELDALLARAQVAVSHGGPGLISEIRAARLRPIAVPRDPDLGEHVDKHQMRFVERMGHAGIVDVVTTEAEFTDVVTAGLADPQHMRTTEADDSHIARSVGRFAHLVDVLLGPEAGKQVPMTSVSTSIDATRTGSSVSDNEAAATKSR